MNDRCAAACVVGVCLMVVAGPAPARTTYRVTDLGTLAGMPISRALAINSSGVVVGWAETAPGGPARAFIYRAGALSPLPNLAGGSISYAMDINDDGDVAGIADNGETPLFDPTTRAVRWVGGAIQDLGTVGGDRSWGYGINDAGHVVGSSQTQPFFANEFAFLYDGAMHDLGVLAGGNNSTAFKVNSSDDAAGYSINLFSDKRATLWRDGEVIDIGSLSGTVRGLNSWAFDINDAGLVAGFSDIMPPGVAHHSFLYDSTTGIMTDIGSAEGFRDSEALALNNRGEVVGTLFSEFSRHAFVYGGGSMRDLNDLVPPGSGWELIDATGINDAGQIVGVGDHAGQTHAFLLEPCRADLNEDFIVDFADYLEFLNRYDAQDPSVDFNHDGLVDFSDYLEFLNLYDAEC